MATRDDVRRIALSFPDAEEAPDHFAFGIRSKGKPKGFAWVWTEAWRCQAPKALLRGEKPASPSARTKTKRRRRA